MKSPSQVKKMMRELKKLRSDYEDLKSRASMAGAKYRSFRSNWRNGVVGVDAPSQQQTAKIYKDQVDAMESYAQRHLKNRANRLKSK